MAGNSKINRFEGGETLGLPEEVARRVHTLGTAESWAMHAYTLEHGSLNDENETTAAKTDAPTALATEAPTYTPGNVASIEAYVQRLATSAREGLDNVEKAA